MKKNEKYNSSCIKIFNFLKLLLNDEAEYEEVIKIFSDEVNGPTANPNVILNKYLNTLKIFGIEVEKVKNKYCLYNAPITIAMNEDDLKCINSIKKFMEIFPDGKNKKECELFIKNLETRLSDTSKEKFNSLDVPKSYSYSSFFEKYAEQITICEKYIQDKHKVQITYFDRTNEYNIMCIPKELNYKDGKIHLLVVITNKCDVVEIPIDNIKNMSQLPNATNGQITTSTVSFKLFNRLAENYTIRPNERVGKFEDNWKVIINTCEDMNILAKRLMRYGADCEVIYPKYLKDVIKKLIKESLANYE